MSAEVVRQVVERAMSDSEFRRRLAERPEDALAGYELTAEERAAFARTALGAERLEDRISKTDLSASFAAKTASPLMRPPSGTTRRG